MVNLVNPGKRIPAVILIVTMSAYALGLTSGMVKDLIEKPLLGGISLLTIAGMLGFLVAWWLYKMDL